MNDEQIEDLVKAIAAPGKVFWMLDERAFECCGVVRKWRERYSDGSYADTTEPAVRLKDGTMAALWVCELSQFVRIMPAI